MSLVQVASLVAGYGNRTVLESIDLTFERGEWIGLLGSNGTGKTTLIRSLLGTVPAMSGEVTIDGFDVATSPELARSRLSYAIPPEQLPLGLTGRQFIALNTELRWLPSNSANQNEWIDRLGLQEWLDVPLRVCSLGTQQKFSILATVLSDAPLLVFDESLNGIDPVVSIALKRKLQERVKDKSASILLATHMVDVVRSVCSRTIIIGQGQVLADMQGDEMDTLRADSDRFDAFVLRHLASEAESV